MMAKMPLQQGKHCRCDNGKDTCASMATTPCDEGNNAIVMMARMPAH
jgi:hypothetical protein